MQEVEAKLRLARTDARRLQAALKELGARRRRSVLQEDVYFRHPRRDFARSDEALRWRRFERRSELTYKGPRKGGRHKSRLELTLPLRGDPKRLLEAVGFVVGPKVRKRRTSYLLGDAEISFDDVAGLGFFVEVEARRGGARTVDRTLRRLGLDAWPLEARSYLEMLRLGRTKPRRGP